MAPHQHRQDRIFIERGDRVPGCIHPSIDFLHRVIERRGFADIQIEQPRPGLVAYCQEIGKAPVDHQHGRRPIALQERIGGNGGAHFDMGDATRRQRRIGCEAQRHFDARQCRVVIALGIVGEQLGDPEMAVGIARHDIGEGAAAINPELPRHRWIS